MYRPDATIAVMPITTARQITARIISIAGIKAKKRSATVIWCRQKSDYKSARLRAVPGWEFKQMARTTPKPAKTAGASPL
jgi:hypothetical protein